MELVRGLSNPCHTCNGGGIRYRGRTVGSLRVNSFICERIVMLAEQILSMKFHNNHGLRT